MAHQPKAYTSDDIKVTFNLKRCIHAARCVNGLPAVFDTDKKPWIQPANATADDVANIVMQCPTGALQFERTDGGPAEPTPDENTVQVIADGPLYVRGDLTVTTPDGEVIVEDTRMALCRCGASQHKPFCDNSHIAASFKAEGSLGSESLGGDVTTGALTLTVLPNGPVLINGTVKVMSQDKQTVQAGSKGALCRCGASQNKPFCDGTHNMVGFQAE